MRFLDFLCENNAQGAVKLINGKILECAYTNQLAILQCFELVMEIRATSKEVDFIDPDIFCR